MTTSRSAIPKLLTAVLIWCFVFPCIALDQNPFNPKITDDEFYLSAYTEIADMLDGKKELSIKRAVFLQEWAYMDGKLDYKKYCHGIDTVSTFLQRFITANGLQQYKTAGNYALFEYFCRPYSGNGYKPFTYDYEDFGGTDDFTQVFITKLIHTHSGQCRSLPIYYKILAEAIGAEAHIAFAPQHVFIRHRDEMEPSKWVNVELTTQSLSREIFYIEHFGISDDAIRNKVYLYPLTDSETVAYLLSELAVGYFRKHGRYDEFMLRCADKSLEYYPQNITALHQKGNVINARLMEYMVANDGVYDDYARLLDDKWKENFELVKELGWTEMTDEIYEGLLQGVTEAMKKDGLDETAINAATEDLNTNYKP